MKEFIIKVDERKKDIMGNVPLMDKPIELVRCKDCKYNIGEKVWLDGDVTIDCDNGMGYPPPDWFCADGKAKKDEQTI